MGTGRGWKHTSDCPLLSFGHCIVCLSSIYAFWLPLCCLLAIVFSVFLRFTPSDCAFWFTPSDCPFWFMPSDCPLWFTPSDCPFWFTPSDCPFAIFWPLYCLSFFDLRLLIAPLLSFGHCIVCLSSIYAFWLPLCYLLAIVLSVFLRFTPSDCLFWFTPSACPFWFTPSDCPFWFTPSDCPFNIFFYRWNTVAYRFTEHFTLDIYQRVWAYHH